MELDRQYGLLRQVIGLKEILIIKSDCVGAFYAFERICGRGGRYDTACREGRASGWKDQH